MYLAAAILKNGRHLEFWNFFRWLTGFIKRAISKEYVCQFWCLFPEMKDSYDILLLSAPLYSGHVERTVTLNVRLLQPKPKERTTVNIPRILLKDLIFTINIYDCEVNRKAKGTRHYIN